MPLILDGRKVRDEILSELKPRIKRCEIVGGRTPGLAVVLAGNDPASEIYVRNKVKACEELGLHSVKVTLPETASTEELLGVVGQLNRDQKVDGILVQMPLPKQVDGRRILESISPEKDADGFHPVNVGRLVSNLPAPRACTPAGVMEMLRRNGIAVEGKRAVVIGRSDIVGKPMALLLLHANATVTICHSKTPDLAAVCREAEILVAAIGRPAFVRREFIRPGAVVIDVGINRVAERGEALRIFFSDEARMQEFDRKRSALVGDVHPLEVEAASACTPVPGGVGPLTIAMLMANTVGLAEARLGL
jgi:methylenetetrahydrofolate dehydrogenase (NADP+)/methenyltetrahydrofolate cyclohydrolase